VLACLLHDASECYLSDVPRPFKKELPGYRVQEGRLLTLIYERYLGIALTEEEERLVKEIDDGALFYDLKELLHNEQSEEDPQFHVVPDYEYRPFLEVEQEYLQLFYHYYEKMKAVERIGNREAEEGKALSCNAVDAADAPLITRAPERPAPDYELLAAQLKEFALTDPAPMPLLSNASALLKDAMGDVNWAGFYLRREKTESADGAELGLGSGVQESGAQKSGEMAPELVLGPFQGKTACIRIPWGRGVCGTAALSDSTQLVPDVHEFPGHIACDSASNSEIVVPIHDGQGNVAAVLDIDSPLKGRFTEEDREGLEAFVRVLEKYGAWNE
jgi:GAF domain-containing protein